MGITFSSDPGTLQLFKCHCMDLIWGQSGWTCSVAVSVNLLHSRVGLDSRVT